MEFSTGTVVLIIGWGVTIFVLWNLHRYAKAFSGTVFWKTAAGLTLAAVAVFGGLMAWHYRHAVAPPSVLVFPFIEQSSGRAALTPFGFGLADQLSQELQQRRTSGFYPLPTAAVFNFAASDSLILENYAVRFARAVDLPFIGLGSYSRAGEQLLVQFQLIDLARNEPVLRSSITIADTSTTGEVATGLGEKLGDYFEVKKPTSFSNHSASALPVAEQNAYYAAYLHLLQHRLKPALVQATALARQDSSQPLFLTLEARVRMELLRQQRAGEAEWRTTLTMLIAKLQNATRRDSLHAPTLLLLGECCLQGKKWREAEHMLSRARALDPTLTRVYVDMAQLHRSRFAQEGFGSELELYQHALKLNPLELEAMLGAVEYFLRENRRSEALALLEKYLRLNPNHVATLMALGRIYVENGDVPKLLPLFETIVRLDPRNVEAFYNLGITYYHRNDLDSAMRFFQRALQIADYPDAHLYLAQIYERRADTTAALRHLRARIRLSSGDDDVYAAEARQHLYRLLLKRGEIPEHLLPEKLEDSNQRKH